MLSRFSQYAFHIANILKVWQTTSRRLGVPSAYREEVNRNMQRELYTQREAAERLRINPKALRRLVREGRLPELRLGPRLPRYRARDLDALVVAA